MWSSGSVPPSTMPTTRPRMSLFAYESSRSAIEIATRGSLRMLRSFVRPVAVFTRIVSPSRSIHTGETCGEPSGSSVAR